MNVQCMSAPPEQLTTKQAAEYLSRAGLPLTAQTLAQYRYINKGPRFIRARGHFVRYTVTALDAYVAERDAQVAS